MRTSIEELGASVIRHSQGQAKVIVLTAPCQHLLETFADVIRQEKNKRYTDWEGRNKTSQKM